MRLSLTKSVLLALVLLQCTHVAYAQKESGLGDLVSNVVSGPQETTTAAASNQPVATTTTEAAPATTTQAAQITTTTEKKDPITTTTAQKEEPKTTAPAASTIADDNKPTSTTTGRAGRGRSTATATTASSDSSSTNSSIDPSDQPSSTSTPEKNESSGSSNKTAIVAGSVVGCLVGVALIGGILTWMNRRGGCTSRTRRRDKPSNEFEGANDYKMSDDHVGEGMHASNSPFQHARRFVPPTSGYMNLNDEEHGYHQDMNTAAYQYPPEYNSTVGPSEYYQQNYYATPSGGQPTNYAPPTTYSQPHTPETNLTTANAAVVGSNLQQMKPDQIDQKPNAA